MTYKRPRPHTAGAGSGYAIDKYKHVYLPIATYGGVSWIAIASDAADIAAEDSCASAGAGAASPGEISDCGMTGFHMDADGDLVGLWWPIPYDCDVKSDIDFRVHWSSGSTTATDSILFKVVYTELTPDTTQIDIPATALGTAIASDTDIGTKDAYQITGWGTITAETLTNERVLAMTIEMDAADATTASEATYAILLEIRYVRRAL